MIYPVGALKRDTVTGASALKQENGTWGVMPVTGGAFYWPEDLVADWPDMVEVIDAGG